MGAGRPHRPTRLNVRILRLAAGGDGVGRLPDGRTVFVPRTAPGDLVELSALQEKKRWARARPGKILEAGPDRCDPPCQHYTRDECGGCQLQHLLYRAQISAKGSMVGETLRRVGRLSLEDPVVEQSPSEWEYRSRITLAVDGPGGAIGFRRYDRPAEIFQLEHCHIASPALMEVWRALAPLRHLLPPNAERIRLRLDRAGGRQVIVETAGPGRWPEVDSLAKRLAETGVVLWWRRSGGAASVVGETEKTFPAQVFEQVHPAMGDRIRAAAVEALGAVPGSRVWDLYAGIGETTALLVSQGAVVESVEVDRAAVEHAKRRFAASELPTEGPRPRLIAGRVEDAISDLTPPDLIVTNPPRTGMDASVVDAIAATGARRVVYISCDSATLARDLARLNSGYLPVALLSFDLFPQTAHVESIVTLEAR